MIDDSKSEYTFVFDTIFSRPLYDENRTICWKEKKRERQKELFFSPKPSLRRNEDETMSFSPITMETSSPIPELIPANIPFAIPPEKKSAIFIQRTITNLEDLIQLIADYPYDPEIEYNICLESLHKIKEPLMELNDMIGLQHIKTNVFNQILYFLQGFHKGPQHEYMHTVIYGPPGTGKTEIAKMIGRIFSQLGILSKGIFRKVTRSELVAGYLGQTAIKTQTLIKECLGGCLFIDEAYALGNQENKDSFSKECIDTLCEALSDHKDDLMVIIAGYEKELNECFFSYNQGLESRFIWRYFTESYNADELQQIFCKKVAMSGWTLQTDFFDKGWFEKRRAHFVYNGRDMESLLTKVKMAHSNRVFSLDNTEKRIIKDDDIENGYASYLKNGEKRNKELERTWLAQSMYI